MTTIIGLSGSAGSGKTTVSDHFVFMGYKRLKFAAPLKNMMRSLLMSQGADTVIIERMIEGDMKELPTPLLNGKSPRYAMQTLGTDWGRALIDENLWSDSAVREIDLETNQMYVFDDVRFQNEADVIRAMGGTIVQINRIGVAPVNNHVSEALIEPDVSINNNRTVDVAVKSILAATGG